MPPSEQPENTEEEIGSPLFNGFGPLELILSERDLQRLQRQQEAGWLYGLPNPSMGAGRLVQKNKPTARTGEFPLKKPPFEEMLQAARKVLKENAVREKRETSANDRRSHEYEQMRERERMEVMTAREIVNTERPIQVESLPSQKRMEIAQSRLCTNFPDNEQAFCNECGFDEHQGLLFLLDGHVYCGSHLPYLVFCEGCSAMQHDCEVIRQYDSKEVNLCRQCRAVRNHCSHCMKKIKSDHAFVMLCDSCMDEPNSDGMSRQFSLSLKWVGSEKGKIMQSSRMFSTELEGYGKSSTIRPRLVDTLPKEAGVSGDGSLGHNGNEFEVQTPRLAGSRGEEFVERICAGIREAQGFITERCGMHIHLDGAGIILPDRREYPAALLQLWKAHIVFEDVLLSFLPFSRRTNKYCQPISTIFALKDIEMIGSLLEAEKLWYKRRTYHEINNEKHVQYHPSRYYGINFHPLFGHGHMEVRYHSGTFIAQKVLEWANIHALIMDAAVDRRFNPSLLTEASVTPLAEKTEMLFDVIGLADSSRKFYRARQKKFIKKQEKEGEEVAPKKQELTATATVTATDAILTIANLNRLRSLMDDSN